MMDDDEWRRATTDQKLGWMRDTLREMGKWQNGFDLRLRNLAGEVLHLKKMMEKAGMDSS
jgi:hypothetical protein